MSRTAREQRELGHAEQRGTQILLKYGGFDPDTETAAKAIADILACLPHDQVDAVLGDALDGYLTLIGE